MRRTITEADGLTEGNEPDGARLILCNLGASEMCWLWPQRPDRSYFGEIDMIRTLLCSTALLIAAPSIAQTASAPASPQQAAPAAPAAPAQDPAQTTTDAQPAQPATGATTVAAIVDSEFPAYDADKSGQLEKVEFSKWIVALKDQELKSTGKTLPPAEVTAWADGAFVTADADKSTTITKAELVTYLSGGAA
jgi:hypothetical protein